MEPKALAGPIACPLGRTDQPSLDPHACEGDPWPRAASGTSAPRQPPLESMAGNQAAPRNARHRRTPTGPWRIDGGNSDASRASILRFPYKIGVRPSGPGPSSSEKTRFFHRFHKTEIDATPCFKRVFHPDDSPTIPRAAQTPRKNSGKSKRTLAFRNHISYYSFLRQIHFTRPPPPDSMPWTTLR